MREQRRRRQEAGEEDKLEAAVEEKEEEDEEQMHMQLPAHPQAPRSHRFSLPLSSYVDV